MSTRTIENDNLSVEFETKDTSFSHEFGVERTTGYEITKIQAYMPALDSWMDVTHMSDFLAAARALVEKEME